VLVFSGAGRATRVSLDARFFWFPFAFPLLAALFPERSPAALPSAPSPGPSAPAVPPETRYLIVVARDEPGLCEYLARQYAGDSRVRVVGDRRCRGSAGTSPVTVERRQRGAQGARPLFGHLCWIVEASFEEPSPVGVPARPELERRGSMEGLEDRQRVDRWIEESQYLIGRLIPGLLDDRDRLKGKLEAAEQECARLRHEAAELRKEISDLQSETQYFRTEHVAMADALREVIEHVGQIQKPLSDVHRRLQVTQPALSSA
jgi:hypothetical protein